jgi:hypothetical protein
VIVSRLAFPAHFDRQLNRDPETCPRLPHHPRCSHYSHHFRPPKLSPFLHALQGGKRSRPPGPGTPGSATRATRALVRPEALWAEGGFGTPGPTGTDLRQRLTKRPGVAFRTATTTSAPVADRGVRRVSRRTRSNSSPLGFDNSLRPFPRRSLEKDDVTES